MCMNKGCRAALTNKRPPHYWKIILCLPGCDSFQSSGWLPRVSKELSSSIFRVPCLGLCKLSRLPFARFVCFVAWLLAVGGIFLERRYIYLFSGTLISFWEFM